MTSAVGIRLEAPMQAWPLRQRGQRRDTHTRPTKSGVVGLVANALGRDFADSVADLATLRFGVRVDRAGSLQYDYHTTGGGHFYMLPGEEAGVTAEFHARNKLDPTHPHALQYGILKDVSVSSDGTTSAEVSGTGVTEDLYLADASFLAALEGPDELIEGIAAALARPARAVFLGRKAYGPAAPLLADQRDTLEEVLEQTLADAADDWDSSGRTLRGNRTFHLYVEPRSGVVGSVVHDQPISFNGPIRRGARFEVSYTLDSGPDTGETVDTDNQVDVFDSAFAEVAGL